MATSRLENLESKIRGRVSIRGRKTPRVVHGDDLLYRFFQQLISVEPDLGSRVSTLLLNSMAIWLPLDVYDRLPVLLPWVVRDPKCRGSKAHGTADSWSSPNALGYLRDDNSLIKSLPRSLVITGPSGSHISGARIGRDFVAAHVWRVVGHEELASRIPILNSFVPNLVWLPAQIAKLTDVEGGIVQRILQATSYAIYRRAPVRESLASAAERAWRLIPRPTLESGPFELSALNWFGSTANFFRTRETRLWTVISALEDLESGRALKTKVMTTRYTEGLPTVDAAARRELLDYLLQFVN